MKYRFYTCDVFTNERWGGNPLAVLPDARGLSGEQMQRIAREFNYSESTFVLPAEKGQTRRVRIFAKQQEYPFAGHPNVGTAFVLAATGELGGFGNESEIVFEELAGFVPMTIRHEENGLFWCELKAPESLFLGEMFEVAEMAQILGVAVDEIETAVHPPQQASVGLPFIITQLKSRAVLEKVAVNTIALQKVADRGIRPSLFIYVRSDDEFDIRCRMFGPLGGTAEDPATGSANCALVGLLTHYAVEKNGRFSYHIAQGVEMGRPSVLDARTEKVDGAVTGVWIGGSSVMVSEGYLEV